MKENWIYSIGKTVKEVCPDHKFNGNKTKHGLFMWKFPDNVLFTKYSYGERSVSLVMLEKAFKSIYETIGEKDSDRAYRLTEKGISKRGMKIDTFKKKMANNSLTPDVYITKEKNHINFWICEEDMTLKTISLSFSQLGEIYEKLKEAENGKK